MGVHIGNVSGDGQCSSTFSSVLCTLYCSTGHLPFEHRFDLSVHGTAIGEILPMPFRCLW